MSLRTGVNVSFSWSIDSWTKHFSDYLSGPLLSGQETACDVTFFCAYNEQVAWNGLSYLVGLSKVFRDRQQDGDNCYRVVLPDYGAGLVRKFLLLLSKGWAIVKDVELGDMKQLAKDLGVS